MSLAIARMSLTPRSGGTRPWRWAAIVALSLLIHVVAIDVLPQWTLAVSDQDSNDQPLRAILLPPAAPVAPPEPPAPARSQTSKPAHPAHAPKTQRFARLPDFVPESLDETIAQVDLTAQGAQLRAAPGPTASKANGASDDAKPVEPTGAPSPAPEPEALAPATARLVYKVTAVEKKGANPVSYYGVGAIEWSSADGRYRGDLKAAVDFLLFKVNVLASHSEGAITSAGLAPDRYTETPRKRSTLATNFNRDARQSISFSASAATLPLVAGAQDRLSVLFQIGALLRANANLAAPGGHIDIPVAGVRGDVDTWVFETQGTATIEVGAGSLSTAHLRRVPKPGSNDKIIDIWIAHADGGYPARVLYTEPDGSTIEMTLEKITTGNESS
jgi:hypothetical protein